MNFVIPLGFEPKTYCLEGSCSNPTELRNQPFLLSRCKGSANRRQNQIKSSFFGFVLLSLREL